MNAKANADGTNAVSSAGPGNANATNSDDVGGAEPIASTRSLTWEALSQGERHLLIRYNGQEYHLRETRNGKLILTK